MAKLAIVKASTDITVYVFIQNSSLTTGAGLTGLVHTSAGLVCYYVRPLASAAALTLATQTVTGAHSDGGFVEVDATNMPGVYRLDLSDAVCATGVNSVVVMLKGATNMAPVLLEIQLTNFDLNSANPNVNVTQISGDSTAADNAEAFFDGTGYAGTGNVIPTVTSVSNIVTANVTQLGGVAQSLTDLKDFADDGYDPSTNKVQGVVLVDTLTTYTGNTPQTGDSFARLGAPAGASVSADIAAIEAQTDDIGTAGAGLTAIPWNAAWDAEVQSEVQDAIEASNLDHIAGTATGIPAIPAGTYIDQMMDDGTAIYDRTTDSLQAIRDRGDAAWITATGFSTLTQADIRTAVGLASANLDTQLSAIAASLTTALARIGAFAGTGVNTVLGFFQALMRSDATTPSDLGGTYDDATDSLQALRDNVGTNGAALSLAKTTNITGFNDLSAAQVNAEVVDAVNVDTYAEPGQEAPPATTTLAKKIGYTYKFLRNKKTQTATTLSVFDDAGTTVDQKATISDDGTTYTHGEVGTGP